MKPSQIFTAMSYVCIISSLCVLTKSIFAKTGVPPVEEFYLSSGNVISSISQAGLISYKVCLAWGEWFCESVNFQDWTFQDFEASEVLIDFEWCVSPLHYSMSFASSEKQPNNAK